MEREYLKAYQIFQAEVPKLIDELKNLVLVDSQDADGHLRALLALSNCKYEETELRKAIFNSLTDLSNASHQPLIDGLNGIAMQSEVTSEAKDTADRIIAELQRHDN